MIKMVIFDVDGVLTDGSIMLDSVGVETKRFNVQDGTGIKYLLRAGICVAFLTGRQSAAVGFRAKELGAIEIIQGAKQKLPCYRALIERHGLTDEEVCYVGDDLPDVPVMRRVGLPVAVANAQPEAIKEARFVTKAAGGRGAAREVAEKILKDQGLWDSIVARYYQ
ncbi:MAG TPA: HAD-IIIA family hydrolase [Planctomycetota bacterium]|nr:HAD-IIIA family hydrolase [Planctomycetota bacterium]